MRALEIEVKGDPFLDGFPHYYQTIEVVYTVIGVGIKSSSIAQAIELSEEKYCSVKGCLGPQCVVTTRFEVVEFEPQIGPKNRD